MFIKLIETTFESQFFGSNIWNIERIQTDQLLIHIKKHNYITPSKPNQTKLK
jgi:hypothetical protein